MNRNREDVALLAFTATTVKEYRSLKEAARVYGISIKKIQALIESGTTHPDGVTTFDIPISAPDEHTSPHDCETMKAWNGKNNQPRQR